MSRRRVLVTGANGFVGANLTRRLLHDGHDVVVMLRPGSSRWRLEDIKNDVVVHDADIRDREATLHAVGAARPNWVFHLAAHGGYSWQGEMRQVVETNVLGTVNLLDACLTTDFEACVVAGSSSEYGVRSSPHRETDPVEPNSFYAVAKASAAMLWRYVGRSTGRPITILRLYSVFGPWEDPRRLLPTLIVHGLDGRLPPLAQPATARDYVYIDDVVEAFTAAASTTIHPGAIFNVGTGIQTTLQDVVALAARVLEIKAEPRWSTMPARAWDSTSWVADIRAIHDALGWTPRHTLEEAFRSFVNWFVSHPSQLRGYAAASHTQGPT
jgi:nucleoside-diphosphate-sugar epimerase